LPGVKEKGERASETIRKKRTRPRPTQTTSHSNGIVQRTKSHSGARSGRETFGKKRVWKNREVREKGDEQVPGKSLVVASF